MMKLFIGTPVRDSVKIDYHISMIETVAGMEMSGIDYHIEHVIGNPLIDSARTDMVERFLRTDCSHLLFIDSDISWSVEAIRTLIDHSHLDVVGGVYPKKKVSTYPIESKDRIGTIDDSMYSPIGDSQNVQRVKHMPTGFMMIARRVFDGLRQRFPDRYFQEDGVEKYLYFSCELVDDQHLGEDINFCRMVDMAGFECYIVKDIELSHVGDIHYRYLIDQQ